MSDTTPDPWIAELRKRLHEQGNAIQRQDGQMLADRMVAEERHRHAESRSLEIKADLTDLAKLVTDQGGTMTGVAQDLRSVLQRMDADEQTRIKTAAALQAADDARRQAEAGPWVTPNRIIGLMLGVCAILAYIASQFGGT